MKFGESIKELRKAKGLKQKELAEKAGISANALSLIEKGETMPHKDTIKKIVESLGVPETYVLFFAIESSDVPEDKRQVFDQLHNSIKNLIKSDL